MEKKANGMAKEFIAFSDYLIKLKSTVESTKREMARENDSNSMISTVKNVQPSY